MFSEGLDDFINRAQHIPLTLQVKFGVTVIDDGPVGLLVYKKEG